jgi:hypothetical protein
MVQGDHAGHRPLWNVRGPRGRAVEESFAVGGLVLAPRLRRRSWRLERGTCAIRPRGTGSPQCGIGYLVARQSAAPAHAANTDVRLAAAAHTMSQTGRCRMTRSRRRNVDHVRGQRHGGNGKDKLRGESGNDRLFGRAGQRQVERRPGQRLASRWSQHRPVPRRGARDGYQGQMRASNNRAPRALKALLLPHMDCFGSWQGIPLF